MTSSIGPRRSGLLLALILSIVAVTALGCGGSGKSGTTQPASKTSGSAALHGGFALVFGAEPTAQVPVNQATMARVVSILRRRIAAVIPGGESTIAVTSVGGKIFVHAGSRTRIGQQRLISLVGTTARMVFYDWEANALTPSGRTVASLLLSGDPTTAVEISQGSGPFPPGSAGAVSIGPFSHGAAAGSMSLYRAVLLAAKQPYSASKDNARFGPEYFAFGAPGSAACATAARDQHAVPLAGQHCYLAGPADNFQDLYSSLPTNVSASDAEVFTVQRGTVVLRALPASFTDAPAWGDPTAQFYVLRDHVALVGADVTNPQQSTDQEGNPDVTFGFNSEGQTAYHNVTAAIAHRGELVSGLGTMLNQHFAVALDAQLLTVPQLDYRQYPDGISGDNGAEITGGFTISSAQDLATQLRFGALPINLKPIGVVPQH
jgi:SecD/SecF fusion protein